MIVNFVAERHERPRARQWRYDEYESEVKDECKMRLEMAIAL